jgi:outer membrane immunogenic protein
MSNRQIVKFALLATLFGAGAAQAADLQRAAPVYKAPPPVEVFSWTGFYIGGNIGYGTATGTVNISTLSGSEDLNGVLGGGQIGYNWQVNNWVLGIELDGQGTDQHATSGGTIGPVTVTETDSIPWFMTARARVGYAFAPMWMVYATAGGALVDFKSQITATGLGTATWEISRGGWAAGVGIEGALNRNWSWKAEYLHLDTGTFSTTVFGIAPASVRLTDDIGRGGFNYRF